MNCRNCGTVLNAADKFCLNCGTLVDMPAPVAPVTPLVSPTADFSVQAPAQNMAVPVQPMAQPVAPVQQPVYDQMAQQVPVEPVVQQAIEKGIDEYATTGLPVGQPLPEPVMETMPVGPSLADTQQEQVQPEPIPVPAVTPVQVIPGAPIAPMPGYGQPTQPEPKKDNKKLFIIIGGILLVTIVAVVVLFMVFGKDKEEPKDTDKKENETTNKEPENEPEKEPEVPTVENYQLALGNFTFSIPNDYSAEFANDAIVLSNDTYYFEFATQEGATVSTKTADELKSYFEGNGVTVIETKEITVNGEAYLVAHIYYDGIEAVYVYTKSTPLYVIVGFGFRLDYGYDDNLVTEMISILENVEYSTSSNMNVSSGIGNFKSFK